ncbi:MAG: hypothetical protein CMJ83_17215 [Planctomycetes bacterium]|nr:hypothetical protein [Planctomycetota bacterium]
MRSILGVIRRSLKTRWLYVRARFLIMVRRSDVAHDVLLHLVTLDPASFRAHFLLGRTALHDGRRHEAVQELAICHRLDPDRFLRQPLPAGLVDEVTTRCLAFPESPMFGLPPADAGPLPGEWDDLFDSGWNDDLITTDSAPEGTDFVNGEEYRRFRDLPPIDASDLEEVNLDELLMRLVEDPHPGGARDQS